MSERSFAAIIACAAALAIGGGGWAVSGRSQEAAVTAETPLNVSVSPQLSVTVENPFVQQQDRRHEQQSADDVADEFSSPIWPSEPWTPKPAEPVMDEPIADEPTEEEATETELPPIYRLPPVTPVAPELPPLGEIAGMPTMEPSPTPSSLAESDAPSALIEAVIAGLSPELVAPTSAQPNDAANVAPYTPRVADAYLYAPTSAELTAQLLPAVQRGCALAQRGALYAAQAEFIQVVRRVAQANDAECGTDQHSRALAEGLRALDEGGDFIPDGTGLEGELDVQIAASSHRTPVVRERDSAIAPHTAAALYHSFAEERLAAAVGGQQAGSMALYGLGKVHARLSEASGDSILATRSAMTMYAAALAASPTNHLAANELGVLLCRTGHPAEAARLFEQSIDYAPCATAYHNLAVAQQKLGLSGPAAANQQEADRLAAWERSTGAVSRRAGIQWVSPSQMAQVASPPMPAVPVAEHSLPPGMPTAQNAPAPVPNTAPPALPKSPWQKAAEIAKSLPLPGAGSDKTRNGAPGPRVLSPGAVHSAPMVPWR
ncbi:MAG: hypothetical protein WD669_01560 [Pirellulales bacterium]